MSPTKNFFLQLVSKFCSAIARRVPRGFTWCNRPWNVSIRFCCSERCYKWYLIFFFVGPKLLKQTCSMKAPWQEVGSYTTHLMSLFVCQTNNFTYTFKSSLYFHSVSIEKGNMPMENPSSFWWGGWVRKTPAFSLSLGWYM